MAWCMVCKNFRKRLKDYEEETVDLNKSIVELRRYFTDEQVEYRDMPVFRTMSGMDYNKQQTVNEQRIVALEKKTQYTKLLIGEHKRSGECREVEGPDAIVPQYKTSWKPVGEGQFRLAMARGDMTRTTGEGQNRRFEVGE